MTFLSIIGALLGFLILPLALQPFTTRRLGLAVVLWAVHLMFSVFYFNQSHIEISDASFYYFAGWYWAGFHWTALTTALIGHITQWLKTGIGASFLDCFMIFQAFGYWGIMMMMRTFDEIHERLQLQPTVLPYLLLFVPSVQYWTSMIGKDALMFYGMSLCVWSALALSSRLKWLVLGLLIMGLIRPHISLTVVLGLALAALVQRNFSAGRKFAVFVGAGLAFMVLLFAVRANFHLDLTDPASVEQFLKSRTIAEAGDSSASSYGSSLFVVRIFNLLFRPFFFDAHSLPAVVASVENIGSVLLIGYLVRFRAQIRELARQVIFVRFISFVVVVQVLLVARFTYNVGLGVRERVMITAPLFALFVSVWLTRAAQRRQQGAIVAMASAPPRERTELVQSGG